MQLSCVTFKLTIEHALVIIKQLCLEGFKPKEKRKRGSVLFYHFSHGSYFANISFINSFVTKSSKTDMDIFATDLAEHSSRPLFKLPFGVLDQLTRYWANMLLLRPWAKLVKG